MPLLPVSVVCCCVDAEVHSRFHTGWRLWAPADSGVVSHAAAAAGAGAAAATAVELRQC